MAGSDRSAMTAVMPRAMVTVARVVSALVALAGLTVMVGYILHNSDLVRVHSSLQGMSPITALGLFVAALALFAETQGVGRATAVFGGLAAVIGLVMLAVQGVAGHDVASPWLAFRLFGFDPEQAGRTSVASATSLLMLGVAALSRRRPAIADSAACIALIISGLALMGYAYGVRDLYAMPVFRTMALHSALGFFLLSTGWLAARPDRGLAAIIASDGAGGDATRRQLAFLLAPPVGGWILLQATDAHKLGPAAAMAFLVICTVIPLAMLIVRDGRMLNALEGERRTTTQLQDNLQRQLQERLTQQALALEAEGVERAKAEAALFRAHRMEAVGQLTGGIAHDFNNLLMAVGGNLQLILKKLEADHPARRFAENAAVATDKGAKLTGQLLAFSRTQKLTARPVELDACLASARELLGSAMGPTIDVRMQLGARGAWAVSDPDQLELAVLNLALNARDAMPQGGQLTVASGLAPVRLDANDADADCLFIRVSDTGEGMTPDVADKAVEPFFTTKERGKGTGLGLAQVYGFVRQCGGDLRITSQPGQGATIELLLRATAPAAAAVEGADAPIEAALWTAGVVSEKRPLLVIDDDDSVRMVLVEALRAAGYAVVEACDGPAGLAMLEHMTPSAAIIDFIMPGMNGAEVARRAQAKIPGLPVVFVSGYFDTVALDGIAGAIILRKPVDLDGLQRTVLSVLN